MRHPIIMLALTSVLLIPKPPLAQPAPPMEDLPPPPLPDRFEEGESLEPQVTIRPTPRGTVEEYRVSIFAPELGTSFPVSEKRLKKKWQEVEDDCLRVE